MNIKPIKTKFGNNYFRSRTEARWAVFFTCFGMAYTYENIGMNLPNNQSYLPDFYLPDLDWYAEIKGYEFTGFDIYKCFQLNKPCLLLPGIPDEERYYGLINYDNSTNRKVINWEVDLEFCEYINETYDFYEGMAIGSPNIHSKSYMLAVNAAQSVEFDHMTMDINTFVQEKKVEIANMVREEILRSKRPMHFWSKNEFRLMNYIGFSFPNQY